MKTSEYGVPTHETLVAHTVLRLRLARLRTPIMRLPNSALRKLCSHAIHADRQSLADLVEWMHDEHDVKTSISALGRFFTAFTEQAVLVHDAMLVGVGLNQEAARKTTPENIGHRLVEHRRRHERQRRERVAARKLKNRRSS